jgi:hypothetical protein
MRLAQVEQPIVGVGDVFILNTHLCSTCNVIGVGKVPSHSDREHIVGKVKANTELLKADSEWFKNVCDQAQRDGSNTADVLASIQLTDIATLKYMVDAIDRIAIECVEMKAVMMRRIDTMIVQLNDLM